MRLCHGPVSRADTVCGERLQKRAQAQVDTSHAWRSGHGLLIEDMGETGLGYPGQDGGFIKGYKEICDQDFWVLPVCPKLEHCPLSPGLGTAIKHP